MADIESEQAISRSMKEYLDKNNIGPNKWFDIYTAIFLLQSMGYDITPRNIRLLRKINHKI